MRTINHKRNTRHEFSTVEYLNQLTHWWRSATSKGVWLCVRGPHCGRKVWIVNFNTHSQQHNFCLAWYILHFFFSIRERLLSRYRARSFTINRKKCYNKRFSVRFGRLSLKIYQCLYVFRMSCVYERAALDKGTVNRFFPPRPFRSVFIFLFSFLLHFCRCRSLIPSNGF